MFCSKCGKEISESDAFCNSCGAQLTKTTTNSATQDGKMMTADVVNKNANTDGPIDLRGCVSNTAPQEKKFTPLLWAGILCIPVLVIMIIAGNLFHSLVMGGYNEKLFFALLFVEIPFYLLSFPFLLHAKKKHKKANTQREMQKGTVPLLYIITVLTVSFAMICGFANAFSTVGILSFFSRILFGFSAIILVVSCNVLSLQNGTEAYLCFAKALNLAFLIAAPVSYVLGMIFRALEYFLIVVVILIFVFFAFGGVIFIRRD